MGSENPAGTAWWKRSRETHASPVTPEQKRGKKPKNEGAGQKEISNPKLRTRVEAKALGTMSRSHS